MSTFGVVQPFSGAAPVEALQRTAVANQKHLMAMLSGVAFVAAQQGSRAG